MASVCFLDDYVDMLLLVTTDDDRLFAALNDREANRLDALKALPEYLSLATGTIGGGSASLGFCEAQIWQGDQRQLGCNPGL